jgi:methyl coenzyme M reductase subunit D
MGRYWYEDGKYLKKKNTFTDFIACAEHLLKVGTAMLLLTKHNAHCACPGVLVQRMNDVWCVR